MHRKEVELAIHEFMLNEYVLKKGPYIELDQVHAVVEALLKVIIAATVQGERVTFQGYVTLVPMIRAAANMWLKKEDAEYEWFRTLDLTVHMRLAKRWKTAFVDVAKMMGRLVDWEEVQEGGEVRLRGKSGTNHGNPAYQEKAGVEAKEKYYMPFVRGGDDRAPAVLPEPWLVALREARKREVINVERRRERRKEKDENLAERNRKRKERHHKVKEQ